MDDLIVLEDGTVFIKADTHDGEFESQNYVVVTEATTFGELMNMTPEVQAGVVEHLTAF